jgi:8-oxo-dGTP pyrophosphatase MutT (NUDIX family)
MPLKVYFDHFHLLITDHIEDLKNDAYKLIISDEDKAFEFSLNPKELFNGFQGNIALITPFAEEALESIFDYAEGVVAAGGIVANERGEVLCIFRRGFWDLPKGKVDMGETIVHAAQREVTEETGIETELEDAEPIKTYHCYVLKGTESIKETHWYKMKLNGSEKTVPQTEEDITAISWMSKDEYVSKRSLFYPLIAAILDEYFAV